LNNADISVLSGRREEKRGDGLIDVTAGMLFIESTACHLKLSEVVEDVLNNLDVSVLSTRDDLIDVGACKYCSHKNVGYLFNMSSQTSKTSLTMLISRYSASVTA